MDGCARDKERGAGGATEVQQMDKQDMETRGADDEDTKNVSRQNDQCVCHLYCCIVVSVYPVLHVMIRQPALEL